MMTMMVKINTKTKTMIINYHQQPTGNSCGPTCLKMIHSSRPFRINVPDYTIKDICDLCGTDWVVGTPPNGMEKGMKAMGLKYVEYIDPPRPYNLLRDVLDAGNYPILRTITKETPHWIVSEGYKDNVFHIIDPWLGKLNYTIKQLDAIWKQRRYQFFEMLVNED
jgi:ABC-type bacteriocin/lantibiotic exporter with double-glycine peptidase domain